MKLVVPLLTALVAVASATTSPPRCAAQERETYETRTLGPIFQRLLQMVPSEGYIVTDANGWEAVRVAYLVVGDARMQFTAESEIEYSVAGLADEGDIDICVYDPSGARVNCDTLSNPRPVVTFTTRGLEEGTYTAVLEVVSGSPGYVGMLITEVPASPMEVGGGKSDSGPRNAARSLSLPASPAAPGG